MLVVDPHPALDLGVFASALSAPLGELASPSWLARLLEPGADVPFRDGEQCRSAVRDLLRHGGYKPTGRGKPSSEYLANAAAGGALSSINLLVDACNAVSLHSGLPVSVVDLDLAEPPLRVGIAPEGSSYVFNPAGQEIRVDGLVCLFDARGPCANAVKDSQRTKTHAGTLRALSLVWGTAALPGRTRSTLAWYRSLLERAGVRCEDVTSSPPAAG